MASARGLALPTFPAPAPSEHFGKILGINGMPNDIELLKLYK